MIDSKDRASNLAVFADYENLAIGVRDARYDALDIGLVLQRLLDKGNIVVKKAYADWERYKSAKRPMHEAAFELIEIPHVSYSGKNSADIRMVVDALDLCYTKEHVDTFAILSGDSDFSPLVSKLRENDKRVIGVGVKNSSSDLLVENCDEFIYYDDLVRTKKSKAKSARGGQRKASRPKTKSDEKVDEKVDEKSAAAGTKEAGDPEQAFSLVLDTVEALFHEREDNLWGSMVKQTLKRKRPMFAESYYGFSSFNELLEQMQSQKLLELQKDEKSGGYVILGFGPEA